MTVKFDDVSHDVALRSAMPPEAYPNKSPVKTDRYHPPKYRPGNFVVPATASRIAGATLQIRNVPVLWIAGHRPTSDKLGAVRVGAGSAS